MEEKNIKILQESGRYIAYVNDRFFCNGDSIMEVVNKLEKEGLA